MSKEKVTTKKNTFFIVTTFVYMLKTTVYAIGADNSLNYEALKSTVESANSTTTTIKETSKNISDFPSSSATPTDDPKGKALPMPPPKETAFPKPGGIFDRIFGRVTSVQVNIDKEANNNSAILSELVIIYKPEFFKQISSLTVKEWFTLNNQSAKVLRSLKEVQVYRFELTPDFPYAEYLIDLNSGAIGAFLFNRLTTNLDAYPVQVEPYKNLRIKFFSSGFNYSQKLEN